MQKIFLVMYYYIYPWFVINTHASYLIINVTKISVGKKLPSGKVSDYI